MNRLAEVILLVDALIVVCVAPVEMFFLDRGWAKRVLGVEFTHRSDVELWAFCIGVRNLLGAAAVFIGVWMLHNGHQASGLVVVMVVAWYLLLSSLTMGLADLLGKWHPRGGSIRGTLGSSIPPLIALLAQGLWG